MSQDLKADICVIGGGSAGLTIAAGASQMGAKTILIERGRMGGDCLNYGCVPSKALLAAGKAAVFHRHAAAFGVGYAQPEIDFRAVQAHIQGVIDAIAPLDSVERFEGLGVTVIKATARFVGPDTLVAGDSRITARRFVIATGSQALVPPIPGLDGVPYLTNETVFALTELPTSLLVIGGGPIGCELGQAFRHLGVEVAIVEIAGILPKDDPELVEVVRKRLLADGLALLEGTKVVAAEKSGQGIAVTIEREGKRERCGTAALLIAAGRRPTLDGLDLDAAGVAAGKSGIEVDARLRTTNRRIFAAGDVAGGPQFTHLAAYHGGIVIKNALFRLPAKVDSRALPWVTYTSPELAHVGLGEEAARMAHGEIRILRWSFADNDRAQTERCTGGLVKVIATPRGRILGASIVGQGAGDLIHPWALAIAQKLKVGALATMIAPYPTRGEAGKRAAGAFFAPKLFGARTRAIVRFLASFG